MLHLIRTDQDHEGFIALVNLLDKELSIRDGEDHAFYNQFNGIEGLNHVVLAEQDGIFLGCGAFKPLDHDAVEIKRMFVEGNNRSKGVASLVLKELEIWAAQEGYKKCRLETGKKQPEAIALYQKRGYEKIPNYGPYVGVENSVCFQKKI
jgi:putative acetyltransferase